MQLRHLLILGFSVFLFTTNVSAANYSWLEKLSIEANSDLSSFKLKLATRFNLGKVQIKTVLNSVDNKGDAYMVMRLAEMSGHNINDTLQSYNENKGKGWGVLAKNLGIKPGSRAFHSLKRGHDLSSNENSNSQKQGRSNNKGKDKGKGRGKH